MVHLLVSGPLLILLGLSRIGKFDAIDQETFKSLSFRVGGGLILYHSVRMVIILWRKLKESTLIHQQLQLFLNLYLYQVIESPLTVEDS